jgi:hypothetical protein
MKWAVLLIFLFLPSVFATSIANIPPLEERDLVLTPGLHLDYALPMGGADRISAAISTPPELQDYVTLEDPEPNGGPRLVHVLVDIPRDAQIPPGVYGLTFSANEIPANNGQISTAVSVSLGFVLRSYSHEPYLEIQSVQLPPVPEGERANFSVTLISRTTQEVPGADVTVEVLDKDGGVLAHGSAHSSAIPSGHSSTLDGKLDTRTLAGGIYPTRVTLSYNGPGSVNDKAILRVGTLTIDLADATKVFVFNQTNKFQFTLKSNWNKPLTNVFSKVTLLGQTKASAPVTMAPFGTSEQIEVYFDRTDLPPGPVNGTLLVTYQERNPDPAAQESMETHTFTVPLHVDIVMPAAPAKVHTTWHPTTLQVVIALGALLIIGNIIILVVVLRKRAS